MLTSLLHQGAYTRRKIMDPNKYKTMAGVPADQIRSRLAEPFRDPNAYKKVNGTGADLTDIKTGHMLKRVNEVFGIKGLGWNLLFDRDDLVSSSEEKRILARLKFAEFVYFLVHVESGERIEIRIPTSGANENTPQYAEEGAKTVALGTALKGLGFQEDVYLGHLNHRNAATYRRPGKRNGGNGKAAKTTKSPALAPEKGDLGHFVVPFGKYEGKKLSELSPKVVRWYAHTMDPKGKGAEALQAAARAYTKGMTDGNGNGNGNGRGAFVVPFGKNQGKKLSELDPETIHWYAEEMDPINEQGQSLQTAARAFVT